MNQVVFWCLGILGMFIWLVFRPYATAPWKIMGVFLLLLVAQPLSVAALRASSRAYPLKYDYVLQSIDQALGVTAFQVARRFSEAGRNELLYVYESLSAIMIAWYGIHLVIRDGDSRKLLFSYLISFVVGALLYGIVPALGPRYAFGATFPNGNPTFSPSPVPLDGYPNAMPSLHVATAFLLVMFSARKRWLLSISLFFLSATVAATLALEHYVIDLVVAVPFACFAVELAYGSLIGAAKYLAVVLAWLSLIRFAWPGLVQHSWALRLMALSTVTLGIREVALRWKDTPTALSFRLGSELADSSISASPSPSTGPDGH